MLDGVFGEAGDGEIEFHEASELTTGHVRQLEPTLQRRVLRYFRCHRFPKPDVTGRTEVVLTPLELLEALAKFVPPRESIVTRYHEVLAPNARLRPRVVVFGRLVFGRPEPARAAARRESSPL